MVVIGKSVFKENTKSDLDFDLGVVNSLIHLIFSLLRLKKFFIVSLGMVRLEPLP